MLQTRRAGPRRERVWYITWLRAAVGSQVGCLPLLLPQSPIASACQGEDSGRGETPVTEIGSSDQLLPRAPARKRVFISSTSKDLQAEREAIERALREMGGALAVGMEFFGSRPETPRQVCLSEVAQSHVYVGIFAERYGSIDHQSGLSMTELEYREASKHQIPCLIYLKDPGLRVLPEHTEPDPMGLSKLQRLKDELKRAHVVSFFKNPDNLATRVVVDLHNLFVEDRLPDREQVEAITPKELHILLSTRLTLEELKTLCFYLDVEYDNLAGEAKSGKIRELIKHLCNQGMLEKLVSEVRRFRPDLDWTVQHEQPDARPAADKRGSSLRLAGLPVASQHDTTPTLQSATFPKELTTRKPGQIRLFFDPTISYVRVVFQFETEGFWVTGEKRLEKPGTFEYSFPRDPYEQIFEVGIDKIETDTVQPIHIFFYDLQNNLLDGTSETITLLTGFRLPEPWDAWYRAFFKAIQRLKRHWGVVVVVALAMVAVAALAWWQGPRFIEADQLWVTWRRWPKPRNRMIAESFDLIRGKWERHELWQIPPAFDVKQEPGGPRGLVVQGSGLGFPDLGREAFYDFKVRFNFRFVKGTRAAWVLRARPNEERGYRFEVELKDHKLLLHGYVWHGDLDPLESSAVRSVGLPACWKRDHWLQIEASVCRYAFTHSVKVVDPARACVDGRAFFGASFEDQGRRIPYGTVGLLQTDPRSAFQLQFLDVDPCGAGRCRGLISCPETESSSAR